MRYEEINPEFNASIGGFVFIMSVIWVEGESGGIYLPHKNQCSYPAKL